MPRWRKIGNSSHSELFLVQAHPLRLILYLISFLEALYPSRSVNYSLFACVEGMAFATYLYPDLWLGGTNGESVTTEAGHFSIIIILGVNLGFHL